MPPLDDAVKHFLALYLLPLVIAFGGVGFYIAVRQHDHDVAARAVLAQMVGAKDREIDRLKARNAIAETRVLHDSVVVTRAVTKYQTLRDTMRVSDTVWVRQFVAQADSTVHACTELLSSCAVFRVTADSTMKAQDAENEVLRKAVTQLQPGWFARVKVPLAIAAGFYVGQRLH